MYWRFSRSRDQFAEQSSRQLVSGDHALRMPLHAGDPMAVTGPFDCLDYAVWRTRHDTKILAGFEHSLVM
jgi:hypothetical protein